MQTYITTPHSIFPSMHSCTSVGNEAALDHGIIIPCCLFDTVFFKLFIKIPL